MYFLRHSSSVIVLLICTFVNKRERYLSLLKNPMNNGEKGTGCAVDIPVQKGGKGSQCSEQLCNLGRHVLESP